MPDTNPPSKVPTPTFAPAPGTYTAVTQVTIADTDTNATIFYTTDGTNPTLASTVYNGPLSIATNTTIRAFAARVGFGNSDIAVGNYVINISPLDTKPVTFTPNGGQFPNTQSVGLASQTGGATICYTTDGSTPACNNGTCAGTSATYSAGNTINVTQTGTVLKALACKNGLTNSGVSQAEYDYFASPAVATPGDPANTTALPSPGAKIQLSTATSGGVIHYTMDGSAVSCGSPNTITDVGFTATPVDHNVTLKTVVCKNGFTTSPEVDYVYTVSAPTPVIKATGRKAEADGTFANDIPDNNNDGFDDTAPCDVSYPSGCGVDGPSGTLTVNNPANPTGFTLPTTQRCYTVDGTDPACNATATGCATGSTAVPSSGTITANGITSDNTVLKAIACSSSSLTGGADVTPSAIASMTFRLKVGQIGFVVDTDGTLGLGDDDTRDNFAATDNIDLASAFYDLGHPAPDYTYIYFATHTADSASQHNEDQVGTTVFSDGSNGGQSNNTGWCVTGDGSDPVCKADGSACDHGDDWGGGGYTDLTVCGPTNTGNCNFDAPVTIKIVACGGQQTPAPIPAGTQKYGPYQDSNIRTITFGDAADQPVFDLAALYSDGSASVSDNNAIGTSEYAIGVENLQPNDATVCYTTGVGTPPGAPDCNATTGACTVGTQYDNNNKPQITQDNTTFKAIACRAGISKSAIRSYTYSLRTSAVRTSPLPTDIYFEGGGGFSPGGDLPVGTVVSFTQVSGIEGAPAINPPYEVDSSVASTGVTYHYNLVTDPSKIQGAGNPNGNHGGTMTTGLDASNIPDPTCATGTTGSSVTLTALDTWIKVAACKNGYQVNRTDTPLLHFHLNDELATPKFTPGLPDNPSNPVTFIGFEIPGPQTITVSTDSFVAPPNGIPAIICYTAGDSSTPNPTNPHPAPATPSCNFPQGTCNTGTQLASGGTITIPAGQLVDYTIEAVACAPNFQSSAVNLTEFRIMPSRPSFQTPSNQKCADETETPSCAINGFNKGYKVDTAGNTGVVGTQPLKCATGESATCTAVPDPQTGYCVNDSLTSPPDFDDDCNSGSHASNNPAVSFNQQGQFTAAQTVTIGLVAPPAGATRTAQTHICYTVSSFSSHDASDPQFDPASCNATLNTDTTCVAADSVQVGPIDETTEVRATSCVPGFLTSTTTVPGYDAVPRFPNHARYVFKPYYHDTYDNDSYDPYGPTGTANMTPDGNSDIITAYDPGASAPATATGFGSGKAGDFIASESIGASNGYSAYVTWDEAAIYFGVKGLEIGTQNPAVITHLYLLAPVDPSSQTRADSSTPTTVADAHDHGDANGATLPFQATHHIACANNTGTGVGFASAANIDCKIYVRQALTWVEMGANAINAYTQSFGRNPLTQTEVLSMDRSDFGVGGEFYGDNQAYDSGYDIPGSDRDWNEGRADLTASGFVVNGTTVVTAFPSGGAAGYWQGTLASYHTPNFYVK